MIKLGLSTSSFYGFDVEEKFEITKHLGFDGIEIMITHDTDTHSVELLRKLADDHEIPVLALHAPTLLATHFVWGTKPLPKLQRAATQAALLGTDTVVVHPPYRWQNEYSKYFLDAVAEVNALHKVKIAVENMYPWYLAGKPVSAYGVTWEETKKRAESLTFDYSHATVAGLNIVEETKKILPNLAHIHMSDANIESKHDSHMLPGRGDLPLREAVQVLKDVNWDGNIVLEVNTLSARKKTTRISRLTQAYDMARSFL